MTDKMEQFKAALASATAAHGAPNTFGARELYLAYGAPHVNWQRDWSTVHFTHDGEAFTA